METQWVQAQKGASVVLKWKAVYGPVVGGKRAIRYWEATHNDFRFRVHPTGGFITNRRWYLTVEYIGILGDAHGSISNLKFYKFREVKAWVSAFLSDAGAQVDWFMLRPDYI